MSERVHFQEPAHRLFPAFVGLPHRVAEIHPSTRRETGHHLTRIGPRASRDLIGGRAYLRCRAYSAALIGFRLPRRRTAASPVGAKSDASFFQRKAPPKRTEKYQTVVYDSIKVPYRGSHHARPYFSTLLKSQFEKCQKLHELQKPTGSGVCSHSLSRCRPNQGEDNSVYMSFQSALFHIEARKGSFNSNSQALRA